MTSSDTVAAAAETALYLSKDGEMFGPHSLEEAQKLLESGVISLDDLVWTEGMEQWSAIRDVVESPTPESEEVIPVGETSPGSDSAAPIWASVRSDGISRRLGIGLVTAIIFHVGLVVILTIGAPVIFRLRADAPAVSAPEPAPLEVTMVEEPDPPPPEPVQPPPPPDDPPPPPAIPDVPIPTDMAPPPPPTPIDIPQPVIAPPTTMLAPVAPLAMPKPVRVARRVVAVTAAPVDAGPSDYLYAPAPPYPYAARQEREQGTVILLVLIDDAGAPTSVTVEQSSGYAILDTVAQKTARDYRFRVGDSRALRVPITFQEQ